MKNKISYIIMSVLFFNIIFIFYYYFKIVNFLYIDFVRGNIIAKTLITNIIIIVFNILYIFVYEYLKLYKLSYFMISILGLLIGIGASFIILNKEYEFSDYLAVISYFIINTVFVSYSLYFEKNKENVFN